LKKKGIPDKTKSQTNWSLSVWKAWAEHRDTDSEDYPLQADFIAMPDVESMNFWLSRFVAEMRKQDGTDYPPNTVYQICCGTTLDGL
jgi:hypothetical protein